MCSLVCFYFNYLNAVCVSFVLREKKKMKIITGIGHSKSRTQRDRAVGQTRQRFADHTQTKQQQQENLKWRKKWLYYGLMAEQTLLLTHKNTRTLEASRIIISINVETPHMNDRDKWCRRGKCTKTT